jgi:hypothetical protein
VGVGVGVGVYYSDAWGCGVGVHLGVIDDVKCRSRSTLTPNVSPMLERDWSFNQRLISKATLKLN